MKCAVMQPYFMPYIGYWQLINSVDEFVIFDDVNYIKKGYINRNNYLVQGKSKLFSIEMENASQNKKINEVFIAKNPTKLLKSISQEYKKAPYFEDVYPIVNDLLSNCEGKRISDLNHDSILKVLDYLGIKKKVSLSSELNIPIEIRAQDRIIEICSKKGCSQYVNAIGGRELYDKASFNNNNIELSFIKSENASYRQFGNSFVPNLSMIDVLFFNSKTEIHSLLNKYSLIQGD
ncbi:WbqC family protein [Vibrio vulnificus]|uniref:WbqC family protein n=1 Tax=Vibrio vulnificus TaxID=672 RepID=UPI0013024BC4|nr:WbqC family protein [Vibrio vulnificus]EIU7613856.1 WbqC family protein [Vibrio vulnificus]EIU7863014.1 WbqC family protein [Vibrio vulnificus]MCU8205247.1 WbqC family protein [Vibrio vulnificus]MCU8261735.1 WbqC family protein [Vibrio vulnificus]MCU8348079.1 WbqC family protein [Vibrio vulnificus]